MRRLSICIALVLSLAFASDAAAKKLVAAKVCGPSECAETHDRSSLTAFANGSAPTDPPSHGSPWYSVRVTIEGEDGRHDSFPMAILPRAGLGRGGDGAGGYSWFHLTPDSQRRYDALARQIAPYPAAKLRGLGPPKVRVDEVVRPPREPAASEGGGASTVAWLGGGLAALAAGLALFLRRRGRGLPWARPSEG
jgi:hypothetical protein